MTTTNRKAQHNLWDFIRQQLLCVNEAIGVLSSYFWVNFCEYGDSPQPDIQQADKYDLNQAAITILSAVLYIAASMGFKLETYITRKMSLNAEKYQASTCRGAKNMQKSIQDAKNMHQERSIIGLSSKLSPLIQCLPIKEHTMLTIDIARIYNDSYQFVQQRGWQSYDTPLNLLMAMTREVSELIELYTWKLNSIQTIQVDKIDATLQELCDIAIYLIRFSYVCGLDTDSFTSVLARVGPMP